MRLTDHHERVSLTQLTASDTKERLISLAEPSIGSPNSGPLFGGTYSKLTVVPVKVPFLTALAAFLPFGTPHVGPPS